MFSVDHGFACHPPGPRRTSSSATANTYTLVTDDLGTTIKVKVSFTDDASNAETLTSVATAVVSAAANTAPTVANAIPDQAATAGTAFSYAFPANTFSDADTGDTLSYTATKTDDTALPTWLAFAASTRTFSGTPQAADARDGGREGDRQRRQRRVGQRHLRHHGCCGHHPAHADQRRC